MGCRTSVATAIGHGLATTTRATRSPRANHHAAQDGTATHCDRAVADHLLTHPCVDCDEADVRVLDFDHRVGAGKEADVMRLVQHGYSLSRIMAEIAKCDVRCRNCHAKVTYQRMGDNWRSRTQSGVR